MFIFIINPGLATYCCRVKIELGMRLTSMWLLTMAPMCLMRLATMSLCQMRIVIRLDTHTPNNPPYAAAMPRLGSKFLHKNIKLGCWNGVPCSLLLLPL